jgi:hypothetical protein
VRTAFLAIRITRKWIDSAVTPSPVILGRVVAAGETRSTLFRPEPSSALDGTSNAFSGLFGGLDKAVVGPFSPNSNLSRFGAPVLLFQCILHLVALLRGPGDELVAPG